MLDHHPRKQQMGSVAKVYGVSASPVVATVLVCLEEAGAAYELVPVDMAAREQKAPHHLARNPFGKVPAFEDGDLTLFESRAIARHVLRKHKPELLGATDDLERSSMVDVWLEVEAHQFHAAASAVVVECVFAPLLGRARDQAVVDENVGKLQTVLQVYEARLAGRNRFLAGGDHVSLADISHFPLMHYLMGTEHGPVLVEGLPRVKAWWEELAARPAARKVAAFMPLEFGAASKKDQ